MKLVGFAFLIGLINVSEARPMEDAVRQYIAAKAVMQDSAGLVPFLRLGFGSECSQCPDDKGFCFCIGCPCMQIPSLEMTRS